MESPSAECGPGWLLETDAGPWKPIVWRCRARDFLMRLHSVRSSTHDQHTNGTTRIARIWRGRTTRERADEYEAYNYEVGIKPLIQKALGVQCLRDDRETETEFVTISYWESVEAMSRFAGSDPTRIHHLPRDPEFLLEQPERVQIL